MGMRGRKTSHLALAWGMPGRDSPSRRGLTTDAPRLLQDLMGHLPARTPDSGRHLAFAWRVEERSTTAPALRFPAQFV